jgi:hypothetical protein
MRHALTKYPDCRYIWYLDQNAFIMNPKVKIDDHIMKSSKLDELMKKDFSVVPPDSIIKTFSHLKGQDVDVVFTQDKEGLSAGSFVIRNGEWAEFFLETWFDPIYRTYNFQRAETHALVSSTYIAHPEVMLTPRRNTSSNGTRLSSPSWPSSTSALSTRTARTPRGPSTRTETLSSGLPTVWRLGRRRARPKLGRLCNSRGRRLQIRDETEGRGILGTATTTTDDTI